MRKFVDDYLISIIPGIAMTGIKEIDCPEKPDDDVLAFGRGRGDGREDPKPTIFTDYFKK